MKGIFMLSSIRFQGSVQARQAQQPSVRFGNEDRIASKLTPHLKDLYEKYLLGGPDSEIKVIARAQSGASLNQAALKEAGFTALDTTDQMALGSITVSRLSDLCKIDSVNKVFEHRTYDPQGPVRPKIKKPPKR